MVSSLQSGDVRGAQALLDATECTCPNGMLWRGVFDNRGEWYKVPEWIVVEPEGLVEENEVGVIDGEVGSSGGEEDEDKEVEVERLGEAVKVRCRLSSSGQDVRVDIRKGERVAGLIAKLKVKAGVRLHFPFLLCCSLELERRVIEKDGCANAKCSRRSVHSPLSALCTAAAFLTKVSLLNPTLSGTTITNMSWLLWSSNKPSHKPIVSAMVPLVVRGSFARSLLHSTLLILTPCCTLTPSLTEVKNKRHQTPHPKGPHRPSILSIILFKTLI